LGLKQPAATISIRCLPPSQPSQARDQVLVMSNGAFGGIHQKLLDRLKWRYNYLG
jgi:hypothetical protein